MKLDKRTQLSIAYAILAVLLIQVMQGHNERSWWPLVKIDEGLSLDDVMEKVSADYRALLLSDETPLASLQGRINGGDYWSGIAIHIVENRCLADIHKDDDASPGEDHSAGDACTAPNDRLLKVTLAYDGQSLTALFAR